MIAVSLKSIFVQYFHETIRAECQLNMCHLMAYILIDQIQM